MMEMSQWSDTDPTVPRLRCARELAGSCQETSASGAGRGIHIMWHMPPRAFFGKCQCDSPGPDSTNKCRTLLFLHSSTREGMSFATLFTCTMVSPSDTIFVGLSAFQTSMSPPLRFTIWSDTPSGAGSTSMPSFSPFDLSNVTAIGMHPLPSNLEETTAAPKILDGFVSEPGVLA